MPPTKLNIQQEKKIVQDYNKGRGKFARQIARELGVRPQVIYNCLRRNGVDVIRRYNPNCGKENGRWNGGTRMIKGYLHINQPSNPLARKDGWVAVHRLKMEKILGRKLKKGEVVHHKDGDKINNNVNNLEVFDNNGKHLFVHSKKFSRDINGKFKK